MNLPEVGEGIAFGIGKTNYRVGQSHEGGEIGEVTIVPTPRTPEEFFALTVRNLLVAAHNGAEWAVMGVPGPVKTTTNPNGQVHQNFRVTQIKALSGRRGLDPVAEMVKADSASEELFGSDSFNFLTVNDGDLAAQAAAHFYGPSNFDREHYDVIADLINGSGTGGAVVRRDTRFPDANLFHPDSGLWEVGHLPISLAFPSRTLERTISGPAVEAHLGKPTHHLEAKDEIFKEVAQGMGSGILNLAINAGAELVVISGGFAVNTQGDYKDELDRILTDFANSYNPMSDKVPEIRFVEPKICDDYELHGARGAMQSFLTRRAIDKLVTSAP